MVRKVNTYGGGRNTNINGLKFEQTTSLDEALVKSGYYIQGYEIHDNIGLIGLSTPKYKLYTVFLKKMNIDYRDFNSKRWLPDECFINLRNQTAYIIEKKFQNTSGSVDEKLQGCHFKKIEYMKLFRPLGFKVEYLYVFNEWFSQGQYRDTLEYIHMMGCNYFFNGIPLSFLGL